MNSAWLFPDAHENEKLVSVGGAAAWYWACGLMYCRRKQEDREARGERVDLIPEAVALTLFADPKARDHIKALVRLKLWHVIDGVGYSINDYSKTYDRLGQPTPADRQLAGPADHQPEPADIPQPTPSQLGGMARSLTSRAPAGRFQPTPADRQLAGVVSLTNPSDPERANKQGNERDLEKDLPDNKGSGAGARGGRKRASALPVGFGLTDDHIAFGATKDWPEWWMRNRCEQFCDLAAAKGWTYKDWKLALYTFLRNEITYGRGPAAMARFQGAGGQTNQGGGNQPGVRAADQLGRQLERIQAMAVPTNGKALP